MSWLSYSSLIPPNLFILAAMIGVLAAWRTRRLGLAMATGAMGCLYLVSMPVLADLLIRSAEAVGGAPALPSGMRDRGYHRALGGCAAWQHTERG